MPEHEIIWLFNEIKEAIQCYRGTDLDIVLKDILFKRLRSNLEKML